MAPSKTIIDNPPALAATPRHVVPFGVNEMRLTAGQWLVAFAIVLIVLLFTPRVWKKAERFDTNPDYRIPYSLSKDYWLYQRRLEQLNDPSKVLVLGDSVVWGEYVRPDGTLSHFLSAYPGQQGNFINCGVNGLFPLAMEGLIQHYAQSIHNRKVIVHCNLLWMSSPKADLSTDHEERFNHSRLVPQFFPKIPCYRADANERLSVWIEWHSGFSSWVGHLQNAYYGQKSIPAWTLEDDGGDPPHYINAQKAPWSPITMQVPPEPSHDPDRGPDSPRHRPWTDTGGEPTRFDWVPLDHSLQWKAFQRVVKLLRERNNDLLVIIGPFNEHMIAPEQRPTYTAMRDQAAAWLQQNRIPCVKPSPLPTNRYADASHPLTDGYELLAKQIWNDPTFLRWMGIRLMVIR